MDFGFSKSKKNFVKEDIICSIQRDVLRTGMLRLGDKHLKENILAKCRRVNYILQLWILQNLLIKTRPNCENTEISDEEHQRNLKIGQNLLVYENNFLKERTELFKMLDSPTTDEEFNKALVELRDKVVAHWTWLYEQHLC
uniref:Uncharacterized protein n=1 Tax=Globodera rostochiensis TaxID=31243 RepID=A0A914GZH4_GLORO